MSAGGPLVDNSYDRLAPQFRLRIQTAIAACHLAGFDAMVWETYRSDELQELYWQRGRPPTAEYPSPVTNARSNLYSWHGYGLAADIISRSRKWFHPLPIVSNDPQHIAAERQRSKTEAELWFAGVARIFRLHGCAWGGDWKTPHQDPPHFQWDRCKPSPSERARELYREGGLQAVWKAVGAVG